MPLYFQELFRALNSQNTLLPTFSPRLSACLLFVTKFTLCPRRKRLNLFASIVLRNFLPKVASSPMKYSQLGITKGNSLCQSSGWGGGGQADQNRQTQFTLA